MRKAWMQIMVLAVLLSATVSAEERQSIKMLFYGNSFTGGQNLPLLVKQLSESGQPDVEIDFIQEIHGGSRIEMQWGLGSLIYLKLMDRTAAELEAELAEFEKTIADAEAEQNKTRTLQNAAGRAKHRIPNYKKWLEWMEDSETAPSLDYMVLQSWGYETGGLKSPYAVYARKFVNEAKPHGVKPILYLTSQSRLTPEFLAEQARSEAFLEKTRYQAALANELDALTVPVMLAALKLHQKRPELPLAYAKDIHPNQVVVYLTACCFYAAIFDESPVGLGMREINSLDGRNRKDPDGNPRYVAFPEDLATAMQEAAWEAVNEMNALRRQLATQEHALNADDAR